MNETELTRLLEVAMRLLNDAYRSAGGALPAEWFRQVRDLKQEVLLVRQKKYEEELQK
jgi:hypothetical protein